MSEASALRTLNAFAVDLIGIPSAADLFWYVAQNVVGHLNFVDCVIYEVNEAETELRQVAAWGEKNPFGRSILNPLKIPFGSGITGQVAQTGEAVVIDDLLKDRNYIPDTQVARSEICVPLIFRGRVVGVIDSEHPDPHAFGEAELEIMSTVAAMAAAKLELLAEAEQSGKRYQDLVTSHAKLTQEITARKALEAKLFEARRLEALGRLTGKFAHEFNNIMTVILGNLGLLEANVGHPDAARFLDEAKASAERGARLMTDMLAFAQRARLDPVPLDMNALISDFCVAHRDLAANVTLVLADDLWILTVDRKAAENVIRKLVRNAVEATAQGGSVTIRTENVFHTLTDNQHYSIALTPGRYVRLSVSDTGKGIAQDSIPQIFDPFVTTKPMGSGTGLGLAYARGVIQQSGGAIGCTSDIGFGTRFDVLLPVDRERRNLSLTISS